MNLLPGILLYLTVGCGEWYLALRRDRSIRCFLSPFFGIVNFTPPRVKPIFEGINIQVERRDRVGLVGPNGSGKTTLLLDLAGLSEPTGGQIQRADDLSLGYLRQEAVLPSVAGPVGRLVLRRQVLQEELLRQWLRRWLRLRQRLRRGLRL